ncbi:hypothetical protein JNUCC1_02690 [Lentibacillus sp. JNUCC-1]|uniref:hypothetical protein n=1 Tax=Lentibacillus sp. JNUCC-1 TaxID=2654513 RepID=UPI0012E80B88|nr:hypothetical protein [Lentibacillus sp. JNUCC-1]MUV38819.1 hypothetical protein [Lentibacillus sp. JNUCC-1]
MEKVSHEPFQYTNRRQKSEKVFGYIILILFGLGSLGAIFFGVYLLFLENDEWIASCFLIPSGLLLLWIAWIAYVHNVRKKDIIYDYVLYENGVAEEWHDQKGNKVKENQITFGDMDKVLIGNYVDRMPGGKGRIDYFRFGVLVIVMYQNNYFMQHIFQADELTVWLSRMRDKDISLFYTPYDLKQAFLDRAQFDIDFNNIKGIPWEEVEQEPRLAKRCIAIHLQNGKMKT